LLNELSSVEKLINQYAKAEVQSMTESLRSHARDRGWDDKAVNDINVKYENGSMSLDVSSSMDDAEYGTGPVIPKAALRTYKAEKHLENILNADVIDEIIMTSGAFNG
jgi:hypothetical protein